jgi:hypothetical protein
MHTIVKALMKNPLTVPHVVLLLRFQKTPQATCALRHAFIITPGHVRCCHTPKGPHLQNLSATKPQTCPDRRPYNNLYNYSFKGFVA